MHVFLILKKIGYMYISWQCILRQYMFIHESICNTLRTIEVKQWHDNYWAFVNDQLLINSLIIIDYQ